MSINKKGTMNKLLTNPFDNLSETKLLLFGFISFIIGTFAAHFLGGSFPGMMSFKSNEATLLQLVYQNVLAIFLLSTVIFLLGKILNSRVRFIDMLITVMVARSAIYAMALLNTNKWLNPIADLIAKNALNPQGNQYVDKADLIILFFGVLLILSLLIYFFYLLIKGFRIAINSKKNYHGLILVLVVFLVEALSSLFIPYYI